MSTLPTEGTGPSTAVHISNLIAGIVKERFGRGPDLARTTISDSLVVCLLHGGFTTAEQTLADSGRGELIAARRTAMVDAVRNQLAEVVEGIMDRPVISVMSGVDQLHQMQALVFVLEDEDSAGATVPDVERP